MARRGSPRQKDHEARIEAETKRYEKLIESADPELLRKIVDRIFSEVASSVRFGLSSMYESDDPDRERAIDEARLYAREDMYDTIKSMLKGKDG
jgi:Zn-dependent M32 family carboxypeptidase